MGRQAYLTRIALGRSAFEPSQTTVQATEYIQLGPSQPELPEETREPTGEYIQLYDERGNPTNPRAHEHGRRLREAQNDVLASIGVVERRRTPSQGLPGSYEERLLLMDREDSAGNAIALTFTLMGNACTWWIGSLRERILTFRMQDALPFFRIVASERSFSGKSIIYSGFPSRLFSTVSVQAFIYTAFKLRPLERLLVAKRVSSRTRRLYRRWKPVLKICLRLSLELLFYPLAYHSYLQRLGLVPARPLFPSLKAFVPFSKASPLRPFSLYHEPFTSPASFLKAVTTSPFIFIFIEHFAERLVYAAISDPIEDVIIHPDNPDIPGSHDSSRNHTTTTILGLRMRSPLLIRSAITKLLSFVGWAQPDCLEVPEQEPTNHPLQEPDVHNGQTIEVGESRVTDISRLDLPPANAEAWVEPGTMEEHSLGSAIGSLGGVQAPPSPPLPPSPTASQASRNGDDDPRIRITSREGIVEMEVRLPPRVLSTHTEIIGSGPPTPSQHDPTSPGPVPTPDMRMYHRVTQLSTEPSQMIGAICKAQIVTWTTLPLKLVTLRLVASHYLAGQHGFFGRHSVLDVVGPLSDLSWPSLGTRMSRIALCGALELAFDFTLWGCQYLTVTWVGTNAFGWGNL